MTSVEGLTADLHSRDGMTRKRARETLVLVGEAALQPLLELLSSPDKQLRWEAAKAIAALVEPRAVEHLLSLLSDPHSDIRWLAADGLISLGPRSVVPLLQSILLPDPTKGRLQMARRILRELSADNSVLAEVVAPVVEVLGSSDVTPLPAKVERALKRLDFLTGRLTEPMPGS